MADDRPLPPPPPAPGASIRTPGASPRDVRALHAQPPVSAALARPRPALEARAPKSRPDPNPLRLMLGLAGLASASAFTAAMLPSVAPAPDIAAAGPLTVDVAPVVQPEPSVVHVTRYVTLQPGQTAPPQSTVVVRPTPTPIVKLKIVTRTRQSGQ